MARKSGEVFGKKNEYVHNYAEETLVTIGSVWRAYVHMSNLAVHIKRSARVNPALPFYRTQHSTHLVQPVTYIHGTIRRNRITSFCNAMQSTLKQLYGYPAHCA